MFEISFSDRQSALSIDEQFVCERASQILQAQGVRDAEIVIALVDDPEIHQINRDFLEHDFATDVISFVYHDESPELITNPLKRGEGRTLDGEIVISTDTAIREAESYSWKPIDEVTLYLVHGLLHLCGYDDLTDEEQRLMREQERQILKLWNLVPHYET